MKIHSLEFDNVRAVDHFDLSEFPDAGVTIISGDNEAGKSTILDALNAVLTEPHRANNKNTRPLRPVHKDEGPAIRLNASIGPYRFEIFKRWFKKPKSELRIIQPSPANFNGREADDKLEAILQEHVDRELVQTLFMRQNSLPAAVEAVGIPSMTKALDAQGEDGEIGTEDSALMKRIDEEYHRYFTKSGKPVKAVTELEARLAEAEEGLTEQRGLAAKLAGEVEEVSRRRAEISQAETDLPAAVEEVERRRADHEAAAKAKEQEASAAERVKHTQTLVERAVAEAEARAVLAQRVEDASKELAVLNTGRPELAEAAEREKNTVERLTKERNAASESAAERRKELKSANTALSRAQDRSRLAELDDQLKGIDEAGKAVEEQRKQAPEREASDADVRAVEEAHNEVILQEKLRAASAAKLVVDQPGSQSVQVDDSDLSPSAGQEIELHPGTTVQVGDFCATYRPGRGAQDTSTSVENAREVLDGLFADLGCSSVDEVRALRDAAREYYDKLKQAVSQRDALIGSRNIDDLRAEASRLRGRLEDTEDAELSSLGVDAAQSAVEQAQSASDEADTALEQAEAALKPWTEAKAARELDVVDIKIDTAQRTMALVQKELDDAEEKSPREALDEAVEKAKLDDSSARAQWQAAKDALKEAQPEVAESLLKGAETRVDSLQRRISDAKLRLATLTNAIESAEGIAEKVDIAEGEVERLQLECDRTKRASEAIERLRSTLHEHRDAARQRYAAPFSYALKKYAQFVFGPDVSFGLDEKLQVESRTIDQQTVALNDLSGGAQEQLALLTRFAIAELAASGGEGSSEESRAPVIIDDALGSTDPGRLSLMNALFSKVGQDNQVIVLTCFPQRYDGVDAQARHSIEDLKGPQG